MMIVSQWLQRLFDRRKPRIPDLLWQSCVARLPFLHRLGRDDAVRLKALCETFLSKKSISGVAGLAVSNEVAVLVSIQACLPVLNLTLDLYGDMSGVILYPAEFIVPQQEIDDAGVVHEWREPLAGEAIDSGGAIVLSWQDVDDTDAFASGHNVVIHEFAHKIDMAHSGANGRPPFLAAFHQGLTANAWQHIFSAAYDDFCRRVDALERRLLIEVQTWQATDHDAWFADLPLDAYAATNPAEFFAVASEAFFLAPQRLAADYADVYRLLSLYYRQHTL